MADFPDAITTPRTVANRPGVVYDANDTKTLFAEDLNNANAEIVAIETELGENPKGTFDSIAAAVDYFSVVIASILARIMFIVEFFEYSSDANARAAYVSNGNIGESFTKLLLHCDGADASTTFTDETGKAVTRYGQAQIDTAQSKFGGASMLLDGTTDYLTLADSADWNLGVADFSIDCWVRFNSLANAHFFMQGAGTTYTRWWYDNAGHNLNFGELVGGSWQILFTTPWTPSTNTWYHIALVRSGTSNWYMFLNGTALTKTLAAGSYSRNIATKSQPVYIGSDVAGGESLNGWIDEFRFSNGVARWTSNFSVPTSAYVYLLDYLVVYSEATIKTQGSYALKSIGLITTSLNKTLTKSFSPVKNLAGKTIIYFDIRASRTGSNIKIGIHDSGGTTTEITPDIAVADAWQTVAWDISAVADANKDAIDSIIVTVVNADAANTFYLDNMYT